MVLLYVTFLTHSLLWIICAYPFPCSFDGQYKVNLTVQQKNLFFIFFIFLSSSSLFPYIIHSTIERQIPSTFKSYGGSLLPLISNSECQ